MEIVLCTSYKKAFIQINEIQDNAQIYKGENIVPACLPKTEITYVSRKLNITDFYQDVGVQLAKNQVYSADQICKLGGAA
jgi:hypothetical protein